MNKALVEIDDKLFEINILHKRIWLLSRDLENDFFRLDDPLKLGYCQDDARIKNDMILEYSHRLSEELKALIEYITEKMHQERNKLLQF